MKQSVFIHGIRREIGGSFTRLLPQVLGRVVRHSATQRYHEWRSTCARKLLSPTMTRCDKALISIQGAVPGT